MELENLKLKVENYEGKMEIQELKHREAMRALKEENVRALQTLKEENVRALQTLKEENAKALQTFVEEKKANEMKIKPKTGNSASFNGKRKADEQNEFVKRLKLVQELPDTEQRILEGIEKFIICKRRAITNFFQSYDQWFKWLEENTRDSLTFFGDYIFFNENRPSSICFTEDKNFPINSSDKVVFPVIREGWSDENTKCHYLESFGSHKTCSTSSTSEKPGYGKYFDVHINGRYSSYFYTKFGDTCATRYVMLVFLKHNGDKKNCKF